MRSPVKVQPSEIPQVRLAYIFCVPSKQRNLLCQGTTPQNGWPFALVLCLVSCMPDSMKRSLAKLRLLGFCNSTSHLFSDMRGKQKWLASSKSQRHMKRGAVPCFNKLLAGSFL